MDFGRRAVDLVGEDEIRKERPLLRIELLGALIVDHRAHDIGRQEIGGELDPRERNAQALSHGADGEGLREPWYAFEQDMTAREQPDKEPLDHDLLSDNTFGHFPS